MTAYNIIKSLAKQGNTVLGAGCYAAALTSRVDGNKIIKIGNNINDPWLDYYEIIKSNQNNPCVPRTYSFHIDVDNSYYVCVMERLDDKGYQSEEAATLCKEYVQSWLTREEFINIANKTLKTFPYPEHLADLLDLIRKDTDVFSFDEYEGDMDAGGMRRLDMHSGNFLYRDGAIVVTDPWCEVDMCDVSDVSVWWDDRQEV